MNRAHSRFVFGLLVLAIAMIAHPAAAQYTTGTLRGQVLDPQAATVQGAEVSAKNQSTGVVDKTVTTSAGTYIFPSLLPGAYTVAVEAKDFRKAARENVSVLANQINEANFTLRVGASSETIEVTAETTGVQTASSTLSNNYDAKNVIDLPNTAALNGSPLNLAIFAPNTTAQPGGVAGTGGSIGGTRPRDNNFMVDGVDDNNLGITGNNSTVIPDAVAEFNLITNQFSAEYGHSAGGQFNLVTKTGTNNWHGSGEEYFQNRNLNAMDNLAKKALSSHTIDHQPRYDANRLGGTIGGPIVKNKWFIFGAYEYTDIHGEGQPSTLVAVPTQAGLNTLIGMAANPTIANRLTFFPIAPSANSTVTVNGTAIPVGPLVLISPLLQREHDFQVNTDYTTSDGKHHFGARFLFNNAQFILPVGVPQAGFNQNNPVKNRKLALTDTWILNPKTVNDLRLSFSHYFLGLTNNPGFEDVPDVSILELQMFAQGTADPQHQKQDSYQALDTLTWSSGRHTWKFGGQYVHHIYPQFFLPRSTGDNWYGTLQNFVNDNVPDITSRTLRNVGTGSFLGTQSLIAGFVQDDIKMTPRLTLNLGLRYEFWTNPVGGNFQALNSIADVPGVIHFGVPATDKNNLMPRVGFALDPLGNGKTSIRGGFGVAYDVKFQNFASITLPPEQQAELNEASACHLPTVSAWCVFTPGHGNNFLAAGGLPQVFIAPTTAAEARNLTSSFIDDTVMPKILTWSLSVQHELYRNATLEVRYLGTRGLSLPVQFRLNNLSAFDAGFQPLPTYFTASQVPATAPLPPNTIDDFNNFNPNQFAQYGFNANITGDPPLGSSIYHGGSVNFTQRSSHGLYFNANYTYSHTIDDATNEFNTSSLNPRRAQDTLHLGQDRSDSDLDARHKFAFAVNYDVPKLVRSGGAAAALLNGFVLNSAYLAQSGQPVTLQSGVDANVNGDSAGDRVIINPNGARMSGSDAWLVCRSAANGATYEPGLTGMATPDFSQTVLNGNGSCIAGDAGIGYLAVDPTARFVVAGTGTRTTIGRNSFRSPGFGVLNFSVFKNTHITESKYVQLGAEFYNVLNHRNFTIGNGSISGALTIPVAQGNGQYVTVPSAGTPQGPGSSGFLDPHVFSGGNRQIVLRAKFIF